MLIANTTAALPRRASRSCCSRGRPEIRSTGMDCSHARIVILAAAIAPIAGCKTTVRDFARSELFERTFQEGMELVEETAAYLDGAGRKESKLLSRNAALAYAGESMRLTTRLMQIASWLLVQRAVREGDMPVSEAFQDRYSVKGESVSRRRWTSRRTHDALHRNCSATSVDDPHSSYALATARRNSIEYALPMRGTYTLSRPGATAR